MFFIQQKSLKNEETGPKYFMVGDFSLNIALLILLEKGKKFEGNKNYSKTAN